MSLENIQYIDSASISNLAVTSEMVTTTLSATSISCSVITASFHLGTASYAVTAGAINFVPNTSLFTTQSLFASQSINAYSASWVSASVIINSSSYALSSSFSTTSTSASYASRSYNGALGLVTFTNNIATIAVQESYNMSVTRASAGTYLCSFNTFYPTSTWYGVQANAVSSSTQALAATAPTASLGSPYGRTLTGFTMSFVGTTQILRFDPCTASIAVFGY